MHVTHLSDQSSPFAVSSAPPFRSRSGKTSSLRLARLAADLSNGINQQTPGSPLNNACHPSQRPVITIRGVLGPAMPIVQRRLENSERELVGAGIGDPDLGIPDDSNPLQARFPLGEQGAIR